MAGGASAAGQLARIDKYQQAKDFPCTSCLSSRWFLLCVQALHAHQGLLTQVQEGDSA